MSGRPPSDRGQALLSTLREPGLIWGYSSSEGITDALPPADARFRWLHLNLADQRSLRWIDREAGLPPALLALLNSSDGNQRVVTAPGGIGLVLHDFGRELDRSGPGDIVPLEVLLVDGLFITGRRRPVRSADLLRQRLEGGTPVASGEAALEVLLTNLVDSFAALVLELNGDLLDVKAELMAAQHTPDMRDLIAARRSSAQLHKLMGGLRTLLRRLEVDPGVPRHLAAIPARLMPRLVALDGDILGAQRQLRLIREELDLETSQRLNQNVYLLSVLTALMAPATLVTGFFGMNTGDLPLGQTHHGSLVAFLLLLLSSGCTYWLLRRLGLIRTR